MTAANYLDMARLYEGQMVAFLQDLVRIPSVNGRHPEKAVAQRIAAEAAKLNLPVQLIAADPERPNVLVQWGEGPAGFALITHTDTVAEGDHALWAQPPFAAEIVAGRMVGRGTADNKAGIAIGLYNLPAAAIPMDHPLAQIAQRQAQAQTGQTWPIGGAGPANEGYMLIGAGIPTLPGFGPTGGNAHVPDEWVEIASLTTTMATFAGIICDYLATMFAM